MFFIEGNNNARYVVKYVCEGDEYKVTATDVGRMWTETLTSEEIVSRCREMNPDIEAPPKILLARVLDLLDTYDTNAQATIAVTEGNMQINVHSRMAGLLFRFQFNLTLSEAAQA